MVIISGINHVYLGGTCPCRAGVEGLVAMNPSFGALVSYRRRTLGLTQVQLAQRMAISGQAMDIAGLERGTGDLSRHETRTTLALALEWPIELVELLHEEASGAVTAPTAPNPHVVDALQFVQSDLLVLRILRMTLQQWMDDLESRVHTLLDDAHLQSGPVNFDA